LGKWRIEIWKDIQGFDGYKISSFGRVKSVKRRWKLLDSEKYLKTFIDRKGYVAITLRNDNNKINKKIHRLVAMAFIPNPQNKPEVNHKDGNKQNNFEDNLEWNTTSENAIHAFSIGLRVGGIGVRRVGLRIGFPNKIKVIQLSLDDSVIKIWDSMADAAMSIMGDVGRRTDICAVCKGKRKTAFGYKWRYENVF